MTNAEKVVEVFESMGLWAFEGDSSVNVRPAPADKAGLTPFDMCIPFNWDGTPNVDVIKQMIKLLAMCLPEDME